MPRAASSRAFTLVEAMIVVSMVGILAVLAGVAYRKWVRNSHVSEAENMLGNIRSAEESYRAENSGYLAVSSDLTNASLYPSTAPAASFVTAWGGPCANCTSANAWAALNVNPNAPVMFGYAVIADNGSVASPPSINVNGAATSLVNLTGQPWFIAEAVCDLDSNAATPSTTVYGVSASNQLIVSNEGQ